MDAHLHEIFDSVQGEGPQVGCPTLFVRFSECDLRCRWCDTPESWRRVDQCRVEWVPGSGKFELCSNPVGVEVLDHVVERMGLRAGHWVSLTGGEPLLQPEAVGAFARHLAARGLRTHLETHGLAVDALRDVVADVEFVSMDWKLGTDVRRVTDRGRGPWPDYHQTHERFLELAHAGADVCVKTVITPLTKPEEILAMCDGIRRVDPATPLVLQPVTPHGGTKDTVVVGDLMALFALCCEQLSNVRLIPQTHKIYGAL